MTTENPLYEPDYPRSNKYDPEWVLKSTMGPNPLWFMEWLTNELHLEPGQRVLDLGCGTALTSIFLAKEFDVQVYAADLWVDPLENWERVCEAGMQDRVCPLKAEAHALPFAEGFFDAVVSIDAYHYFGTDWNYLGYVNRFVREGGSIGIVVPGLMKRFGDQVPEHLAQPQSNGTPFWSDDCASFITPEEWTSLWKAYSAVKLRVVDTLPDGWRLWRDYEKALEESGHGIFPSFEEAIGKDQGEYMGFIRLIGDRSDTPIGMNLYHPALKKIVAG